MVLLLIIVAVVAAGLPAVPLHTPEMVVARRAALTGCTGATG
jgi:hypothetical protein